MRRNHPFRIGDAVTYSSNHPAYRFWDGTVVDIVEDFIENSNQSLYRVYWRYPLGKVADYRVAELKRK